MKKLILIAILFILPNNTIYADPLNDLLKKAEQPSGAQQTSLEKAVGIVVPYTREDFFSAWSSNIFYGHKLLLMRESFIIGNDLNYTELSNSIRPFDYQRIMELKKKYIGCFSIDPIWGDASESINTEFYGAASKYISESSPESEIALAIIIKKAIESYNYCGESGSNGRVFLNDFVNHLEKIKADYKTLKQKESNIYAQLAEAYKTRISKANENKEIKNKCLTTNAYIIYKFSMDIIGTNKTIQYNQSVIDRQNEIERATGVVDKNAMYTAGQNLVAARRYNAELFLKYKTLGGKASTYQSVIAEKDPCNS